MLGAMRRSLIVPLLVLPGLAQAVVCKTVSPDGVVSYTDVPVEECRTPVKLPDYSRYAPRPVTGSKPPPAPASQQVQPTSAAYSSMQIIQPAADGVVRSNEGKVPVSIALEPALQQGHLVKLFVDDEAVRGTFAGVDIELSGIERGSHTLRAEVQDANGRRLLAAPPVAFTLRKTGLFDGGQPNPNRPPAPNPIPQSPPSGG